MLPIFHKSREMFSRRHVVTESQTWITEITVVAKFFIIRHVASSRKIVYRRLLGIWCYTSQSTVSSSRDLDFLSRSKRSLCKTHVTLNPVSVSIGWRYLSRISPASLKQSTNIRDMQSSDANGIHNRRFMPSIGKQ
jgi:hypothetical protein